jgi:hypothetical protein
LLRATNIQGIRLPGKISITGKAQIGMTVTLSSSLFIQCQNIFIQLLNIITFLTGDHQYQAVLFLFENPSNTYVPSTISVPTQPIETSKLSGEKREVEEEIESDWIPPYQIKLKKIKLEDPRGNFW